MHEDWDGGAGNALGTLYAFQKADALARKLGQGSVLKRMAADRGISVAMYHTAGKGTRLAPLPGSENNNKPGVKLPASVMIDGKPQALTILEAVIKQTSIYGRCRRGRLSVFWGDQVFIPSVAYDYNPEFHVDILCKLGPMPDAEQWKQQGLEKYGLIAENTAGNAAQVEKVDHATASTLLRDLGQIERVGTSLGSFSVSAVMLESLLEEFADELAARKGKLDTDPHIWMPFTLPLDGYVSLMRKKSASFDAAAHWRRMRACLERIAEREPEVRSKLFGAVDVGADSIWWDYGQLKLYYRNMMLLTEESEEARLARAFLGMRGRTYRTELFSTALDGNSVVQGCELGEGSVQGSVLCNVHAAQIQAQGCILVNVTARKIIARPGSLIYNVVDDSPDGIIVDEDVALAGVWQEDGTQMALKALTNMDMGKKWSQRDFDNTHTFQEIYDMNMETDVSEIERKRHQRNADARREVIRNVPRVLQEYIWQDVILRGGTSFLLGAATALSVAYFLRRR